MQRSFVCNTVVVAVVVVAMSAVAAAVQCPVCGAWAADGTEYCPSCGSKLPATVSSAAKKTGGGLPPLIPIGPPPTPKKERPAPPPGEEVGLSTLPKIRIREAPPRRIYAEALLQYREHPKDYVLNVRVLTEAVRKLRGTKYARKLNKLLDAQQAASDRTGGIRDPRYVLEEALREYRSHPKDHRDNIRLFSRLASSLSGTRYASRVQSLLEKETAAANRPGTPVRPEPVRVARRPTPEVAPEPVVTPTASTTGRAGRTTAEKQPEWPVVVEKARPEETGLPASLAARLLLRRRAERNARRAAERALSSTEN